MIGNINLVEADAIVDEESIWLMTESSLFKPTLNHRKPKMVVLMYPCAFIPIISNTRISIRANYEVNQLVKLLEFSQAIMIMIIARIFITPVDSFPVE